jgi:hypothetical protein
MFQVLAICRRILTQLPTAQQFTHSLVLFLVLSLVSASAQTILSHPLLLQELSISFRILTQLRTAMSKARALHARNMMFPSFVLSGFSEFRYPVSHLSIMHCLYFLVFKHCKCQPPSCMLASDVSLQFYTHRNLHDYSALVHAGAVAARFCLN